MNSWDDYKLFLKVAHAGSLREATKEAGTSHATLSRAINRLESNLGVVLMNRGHKGMVLTEHGLELRRLLEPIEEGISSAEAQIMGHVEDITGKVTLTYPYALTHLILPAVAQACEQHNGLVVDLLDSDNFADLDANDADIAVRIATSAPDHLIGRKVGKLPVALYGNKEKYPLGTDLSQVPFVGFTRSWAHNPVTAEIKKYSPKPSMNVCSSTGLEQMIDSGIAVGWILCVLGDRIPGAHRLNEPNLQYGIDVWVFVHRHLKNLKRVRLVADLVYQALKEELGH